MLQIPALQIGQYDIRLEKAGFQSVSQNAQIYPQQETQLTFKLEPRTQVVVETQLLIQQAPAGAQVTVDGRNLGTIPSSGVFTAKILPGEHELVVVKEGYVARTIKQQFGTGLTVVNGTLSPDQEYREWAALGSSNDAAALDGFVSKYPKGRYTAQARSRLEQVRWSEVKDNSDEQQLDQFVRNYPSSQYAGAAKGKLGQLQREDEDWFSAQESRDPAMMQGFLNKYPQGRYAQKASMAVRNFQDQQAILTLLRNFRDAYNRKDLPRILELWPSCPLTLQSVLRNEFKASDSGNLISFSVAADPAITGNAATAVVSRTRQSNAATMSGKVQFRFVKQNDHWLIETGAF